jgi:hypothetical protein
LNRCGDAHGEVVFHDDHLAPRDEPAVDQYLYRLARGFLQLDDGACADLQQFADEHRHAPQFNGHLQRDVQQQIKVLLAAVVVIGEDVERRGRWRRRGGGRGRLWLHQQRRQRVCLSGLHAKQRAGEVLGQQPSEFERRAFGNLHSKPCRDNLVDGQEVGREGDRLVAGDDLIGREGLAGEVAERDCQPLH